MSTIEAAAPAEAVVEDPNDPLIPAYLVEVDGKPVGWSDSLMHAAGRAKRLGGTWCKITQPLSAWRAFAPYII